MTSSMHVRPICQRHFCAIVFDDAAWMQRCLIHGGCQKTECGVLRLLSMLYPERCKDLCLLDKATFAGIWHNRMLALVAGAGR